MAKLIQITSILMLLLCCIADPYQPQVKSGSNDLSLSHLNTTNQNFQILYDSNISDSYDYCLALEQLQIDYDTSDYRYSFYVQVYQTSSFGLSISTRSHHPNKVQKVRLRYLVIKHSYQNYFTVFHYQNLGRFTLDQGNPFRWRLYHPSSSNSQHFTYLLALDATSNSQYYIDFQLSSQYSYYNHIWISISTNLNDPMEISFIAFDILIFDRNNLKDQKKYNFTALTINDVGGSMHSFAGEYFHYDNLSKYDLFYGVSQYFFKNAINETLSFSLSYTGTGLNAEIIQNQKMSISFIIFHRLQACKRTQDYIWNVTSQYCQCPQAKYQDGNRCPPCPSNCLNCTSALSCDQCDSGYKIITSFPICELNCLLFHSECQTCSITECFTCSDGYELTLDHIACLSRCGDGKWVNTFQACDDGNLNDNDGCSSTCQEENQHFKCDNTPIQQSVCKLTTFTIVPVCIVKEQLVNTVLISFELIPENVYGYETEQWLAMFDQNQLGYRVTQAQYYPRDKLLRAKMDYDETADFSAMKIIISPQQLSSLYSNIPVTTIDIPSTSENNLSLKHYSDNVYFVAQIVKYITYVLAGAALTFFVIGNLGAKIAALECIALFQLTALLQLSLENMSPTFAALRPLVLTLGGTPINLSTTYYQSTDLPEYLKDIQISRNTFCFINFFLIFLILPFITGLILKCAARNKPHNPGTRMVHRAWKNVLGTFTFYPLIFLTYGFMLCLVVDLRYFQPSLNTAIGLLGCLLFLTFLVIYLILTTRKDTHFGSFKNKFERWNINEYYYIFECAERLFTASVLVAIGPGIIGASLVSALFLGFAFFIGIKKPYVIDIWKRALFIKIMGITLCLTYIGVNCTEEDGAIALYAPFVILTILLAVLITSVVLSINDIRIYCQDTCAKFEPPFTTEQCHKLQLQQMQQNMFQTETNPFLRRQSNVLSGIKLVRDKWSWDNYPRLYSIDPDEVIERDENKIKQEEEKQNQESQNVKNEDSIRVLRLDQRCNNGI